MSFSSTSKMKSWRIFQLLQLQILLFHCSHVLSVGNLVTSLPGLDGELPFKLETGYVSVEGSEMFYYFMESETNPRKDPLMLWFSGGPGCSAFNGLVYQIGPLAFNITDYEGGLPKLQYVEYTWTKTTSILFVDSPVGTGFSYATDPEDYYTSDTKWAAQNYIFLKKWLIDHPQFLQVQLFIGADSYAGVAAPMIVQAILDGNKAGDNPPLNLKGYVLGCPKTDEFINQNSKITVSHRLGLISDELYQAATEACDGNYYHQKDMSNVKCTELVNLIKPLIRDINTNHILEPKCSWSSARDHDQHNYKRRDLHQNSERLTTKTSDLWCHTFNYTLSYIWANDPSVQKALHVREGKVKEWTRCNESLAYTYDVYSVLGYHHNFTKTNLYGLVYNGDHDLTIPNVGTQEWIKTLNLTVDLAWHPWLVDGEVAGYTEKYKGDWFRLTYATIKGAGHSPQEYKRRESYDMFQRWIHWYPV